MRLPFLFFKEMKIPVTKTLKKVKVESEPQMKL